MLSRSFLGNFFSFFWSHLKCQLLREAFLVHTDFRRLSVPTHKLPVTSPCLIFLVALTTVWHNLSVDCPSPCGECKFPESRVCLGCTVPPEPGTHWTLSKDLLNECLHMAQILAHSQHLRSALKTMTVSRKIFYFQCHLRTFHTSLAPCNLP